MASENWGWAHVTVLDGFANGSGSKKWKCNYCDQSYTGSYSRVRAHLLGRGGKGVKICTAIDEPSRKEFEILDAEGVSHKKKRKCEDEISGERNTTSQPNIRSVPKTISKEEVDCSIARFFCSQILDFQIIKSPRFHDFCNAIAAFGSGFELPSINEFDSILSREKARIKKRVKELAEESWPHTGCTIYVVRLLKWNFSCCILVLSPSGTFFLKHFDGEKKEAATSALAAAITEVGQQNVVQITLDYPITSDFVELAYTGMSVDYPITSDFVELAYTGMSVDYYPITSDFVDSLAYNGMSVSPTTTHSILDLLEQIARERWTNPNIYSAAGHPKRFWIDDSVPSCQTYSPLLNLIRSRENSWDPFIRQLAPSYCLVSTLLELREELKEFVNKNIGCYFEEYILDDAIWAQAQIMLQISQPFVESLLGLRTDKVIIGDVYHWRVQSLKAVRSTGLDKTIIDRLEKLVGEIWDGGFSKLHALGYMLNPKYFSENQLNGEFVMQDWELILETYKLDESPKRILLEQLHSYSRQHGLMREEDAIYSRNKLDPVTWWENFGIEIPELKALAIKIFSQISDVFRLPGDQYFFKWGVSTLRGDLVYVGMNLILEEFSTSRRSIHNVQRIPSKEEVESSIAKEFFGTGFDIDLLKSPYFLDMVKAIAAFGSGFEYPSIDGLIDLLLSKDKIRIERGLMASIGDSLSHTGCTIHLFLGEYYVIFLSSAKGSLCLKAGDYSGSKFEDEVSAALHDAILQVGSKNVVQVFCKCDDHQISLLEHRLSEFSHLFISPDVDSSSEEFERLLDEMIVSSYEYEYVWELINQVDGPLKQLCLPNSIVGLQHFFGLKEKMQHFFGLKEKNQHFFGLKEKIVKMVTSQGWKDWKLTIMKDNMKIVSVEQDILDDIWWADLESILDRYTYAECTRLNSRAIMGDFYSWRVQSFEPIIRRRRIDEVTLNKKWDELFSPLEATGYMLNPKNFVKTPSNISCIMQGWNSTLKRYEPDKDAKVELRKQLHNYLRQEGRMGEKDAIDGRDEMEPVAWWERFGVEVPDLQRLAIRILSQISYSDALYEIARADSYIESVEDLKFLEYNYRLESEGVGILSFLSGLS